ncbi:MAG TPA: cupin domain-containing protein [Rhizomicrobium sp.]
MRALAAAAAVIAITGAGLAADPPPVSILPVTRFNATVTGQRIVVPNRPDVIVSLATIQPGGRLPEHLHRYPHFVYVLEGTATLVNTVTHKSQQIAQGRFVAEPQNTWHYGVNNGKVVLKILGIDQVPAGTKSNLTPRTP